MQEAWAKQMAIGLTIGHKDAENVTNVIWAEHGDVDHILGSKTSNQMAWTKSYTWEASFGLK